MHSMTGFGQATRETEGFRLAVTLRSVNHRFLDLSLRLREEARGAEPALRELFSSRLTRGRLEANVDVAPMGAPPAAVVVEEELVQSLRALADDLAARGLIASGLAFGDLLRLPEVVRLETRGPEWTPAEQEALLEAASRALDELVAGRATEGEQLFGVLERRLEALGEIVVQLGERRGGIGEELAASLRRRLDELLAGAGPDEDRLAQEVAILVDRSDVTEELDRLLSHLEHFRGLMAGDGGVGKRLDFLCQEIFRELNTVGSKCRDREMTRLVVDAKALCEQLREQVQNVE